MALGFAIEQGESKRRRRRLRRGGDRVYIVHTMER